MKRKSHIRRGIHASVLPAAMAIALLPSAFSQFVPPRNNPPRPPFQSLPAAQPTQQQPVPAPIAPVQPINLPARKPNIEFVNGVLTINADNSSLDQILRDVAFLTGMKITGGVADERVYGTYGPDTPQAVLSTLLDGTGTNMLLRESARHTVQELILTPRNGGPTPPNLNASSSYERDESDRPPMPGFRRNREFGERRFPANPENPQPYTPPVQPSNQVAPSPGTTTQQSPNGVKTPQEIYEQLIRQQQQQATPPPQP